MSVLAAPKVLVVGINPWIDNTGINTLINFFDGWDKNSIAHIYTRAKLPNTHMCDKFFRISEPKVMKSVFKRSIRTGEEVFNSNEEAVEASQENQIYNKKHSSLMSLAREFVWLLGKWKTKELDRFLDEYDADVLFFPVYANVYMNRLQNYIRKRTKKPVVLYVSDDNYSYKSIAKTPVSLFTRFWLRSQEKKLFKNAEKIMVIAPKQKEEYDRLFNTDSVILTKGIDFSAVPYEEKSLNSPIKMIYTGKLIIGRWISLAKIAEAMGEINKNETKVELDIYTTDVLTEEQKTKLNRNGCSVKGALTLDEVQQVQKQADILVFVESLEKEFRYTARLSFSTKITDYLKSGKCIFAVGDKDIAPIDYFNRYDSAITATSYDEIGEKLKELINNENKIIEYSKKAYDCGKEHHNAELTNKILVDTITDAVK
ncbi:MAG: hypothetical protein IJ025_09345 [Clostridia bacterium]|nr:hypothetical protein [Clostridia bacterium]